MSGCRKCTIRDAVVIYRTSCNPTKYLGKLNTSCIRSPVSPGSQLQDTRETEFYERMVAHLMTQIFFQETQEVFSENIFCRHTTRPWGRRGGPVRKRYVEKKTAGTPASERIFWQQWTLVGFSVSFVKHVLHHALPVCHRIHAVVLIVLRQTPVECCKICGH